MANFPKPGDTKAVFSCGATLNYHGVEMYWMSGSGHDTYTCNAYLHNVWPNCPWLNGNGTCYCFNHKDAQALDPNLPEGLLVMAKNYSVYTGKDWSEREHPAEFSCGATVNTHGEIMMWIGSDVREGYEYEIEQCDDFLHGIRCCGGCYAENELRFCFRHELGCTTQSNNKLPDGYW